MHRIRVLTKGGKPVKLSEKDARFVKSMEKQEANREKRKAKRKGEE